MLSTPNAGSSSVTVATSLTLSPFLTQSSVTSVSSLEMWTLTTIGASTSTMRSPSSAANPVRGWLALSRTFRIVMSMGLVPTFSPVKSMVNMVPGPVTPGWMPRRAQSTVISFPAFDAKKNVL